MSNFLQVATARKRTYPQDTFSSTDMNGCPPPLKRTKKSNLPQPPRIKIGHCGAVPDVPRSAVSSPDNDFDLELATLRSRSPQEYKQTALNIDEDRSSGQHCGFGNAYVASTELCAGPSGSAVSITLTTTLSNPRNEAIGRQSYTDDGTYNPSPSQVPSSYIPGPLSSSSPQARMTYPTYNAYHYSQSPNGTFFLPDLVYPPEAPYSTSQCPQKPQLSCLSQTNFSFSEPGQYSSQGGYTCSPVASSSTSSHAAQWSIPEQVEDHTADWFIAQQSPSTSTQYSASPLVPPSLSRDSSISPSSICDTATDVYPTAFDTDACGSGTFDLSVYVQDDTQQFPDAYNRYLSNNSNNMSMQNQKLMMTSDLHALGQHLFDSMGGVDFSFASSHTTPGPAAASQPRLEVHCPRPHRPFVPKWQIDPNVDLDQYTLPRNPHPTPCEPALDFSQGSISSQNAPVTPSIIMNEHDVYAMSDAVERESEDDEGSSADEMECEDGIEYEDGDVHYGETDPAFAQGLPYSDENGVLTAFPPAAQGFSAYYGTLQHPTRNPMPSIRGTLPSSSLLFQPVSDSVVRGTHST
ncbi:hypothetical protein K474DRAFT_1672169 [Panus rudis PR-1116 ss-1]|nr:hypothetical protein K474DRAFT_1672169 [Panus rudis PR-1116 ss-1]